MAAPALTILPQRGPDARLDVEIVVPVHNEERTLEPSIRRLHDFRTNEFPLTWQIVIADNASSDATLAVARRLSAGLDGVEVLHLRSKGRGRALRSAWLASPARVVCYMDVDLSTDLRALLPPAAAGAPAGALQRCAVRLQGDPNRCREAPAADRDRPGLVL